MKGIRILGKSLLLTMFAFFFTVNAQDADKLLKDVQAKFNSVKDLSAEIRQTPSTSEGFTGKVYFKKDNKFRVEFKSTTLISNGSTTWNYNKRDSRVTIDEYDSSNPNTLSISTIINDYPSKSDVSVKTEGGKKVLVLSPKKGSGINFDQVKLQINENNLIDKVTAVKSGGNSMSFEIGNYKLNQDLSDSMFSFSPPEGTTVIDLR